jgi:trigger factor
LQIEEIASTYEEPQEVVNYYYGNEQLLNSVYSAVLEDQVVERILADADVKDEVCSYEEAVQPDKPAAEPDEEEASED